jgi:hypothetical protein
MLSDQCFVLMNDLPHDVRFSRFLFWNGYFSITICDAHDVEIVLLGSVIIWKAHKIASMFRRLALAAAM